MRPNQLNAIFNDVESLPGIGAKLANLMAEFIGRRIIDLLFHLPHNLIDRRWRPAIHEVEENRIASFAVEIIQHNPPPRRGLPYRVVCSNETGILELVFFHAKGDWLLRKLPVGSRKIVSGRVERFRDKVQMPHPDHMGTEAEFNLLPDVEPVFPLTKGLSGKILLRANVAALDRIPTLPEWQDPKWVKEKNWPSWQDALRQVHRPQHLDDLSPHHPARMRLAYDELLANQLSLVLARQHHRRQAGRALAPTDKLTAPFLEQLPFALTQSQQQAWQEIRDDMASTSRMLRLLQGDVGSGKTFVALLAALQAIEAGTQAAIMAPTEILARQHAETLAPILQNLNISWALYTGRLSGKKRQAEIAKLADGTVQFAIGTHALFQDDIIFADLGIAIVDEQHRFGVQQRMQLSTKGKSTDVLVMTATPIPRTLRLATYGDMDVSRMWDKPAGRKPIDTRVMSIDRYQELAQNLARLIEQGTRIYWVCPLVSESEMMDLTTAETRFADLQKRYGAEVGLVHGQMKAAEKDAVMEKFQNGDISILVATTVIEVGVDVPEASTMIIEHAERFGLAQLHQLRGRVGRSAEQSRCILLYRSPLGETAQARLSLLRETEDGFKIAEKDWQLRGSGEALGTRQSGLPPFRLADMAIHGELMPAIDKDARLMIEQDPHLKTKRGEALRLLLYLFDRDEAIRYLRAG